METYERIRELRKNQLKLSQERFGEKLGVTRSVIKNIEANLLARPEQKEPLYRLICSTFNVNYEWLTTGEGKMHVQAVDDFIERFAADAGISHHIKGFIKCYLNLEPEQRKVLDGVLSSLADTWANTPGDAGSLSGVKAIDITIEHGQEDTLDNAAAEKAAFMKMEEKAFNSEKNQASQASFAKESGAV